METSERRAEMLRHWEEEGKSLMLSCLLSPGGLKPQWTMEESGRGQAARKHRFFSLCSFSAINTSRIKTLSHVLSRSTVNDHDLKARLLSSNGETNNVINAKQKIT